MIFDTISLFRNTLYSIALADADIRSRHVVQLVDGTTWRLPGESRRRRSSSGPPQWPPGTNRLATGASAAYRPPTPARSRRRARSSPYRSPPAIQTPIPTATPPDAAAQPGCAVTRTMTVAISTFAGASDNILVPRSMAWEELGRLARNADARGMHHRNVRSRGACRWQTRSVQAEEDRGVVAGDVHSPAQLGKANVV